MNATEVDLQTGIVGRNIVGMDTAQHLFQTDGPVIADTGCLGRLQVGIATVSHPSQGWLVVVETNRPDGSCGVAGLTGRRTGSLLTQQAPTGLFINVNLLHCSALFNSLMG